MKRIFLILGFSSPLFAQPFTYLGIFNGQMGAFSGNRKDSTFVTGTGSIVNTAVKAETLFVDQSFTYMGYNAKGIQRKAYYNGNPSPIFEDTVYEVGDTLRRLMVVGRSSGSTYVKADVRALVVPFVVGNSWTLGIAGNTYIADVDGDTNWANPDTFIITKDSMYVVNMGTVTVPAGTFDSVYTLMLRLEGRLWSSRVYSTTGSSSAAWSDSLYRNYYIWWKPGLGYVKDSMFQFAKWSYLFITARNFSWETSELQGYWMNLAENRRYPDFSGKGNGVIYDITGKRVEGVKRRGIYFVIQNGRVYKYIVR